MAQCSQWRVAEPGGRGGTWPGGESGSGKSTLGRAILRLNDISSGQVLFDGVDVTQGRKVDLERLRHETAMIFQDPYAALNPRLSIGQAIAEVLRVQGWSRRH